MSIQRNLPKIPLPRDWPCRVKSTILHVSVLFFGDTQNRFRTRLNVVGRDADGVLETPLLQHAVGNVRAGQQGCFTDARSNVL